MKISIVIPVFNEAGTVREVVSRVLAVPLGVKKEILLVDDGSTDGTRERLEQIAADEPAVRVLRHARNLGKGAALRTGFQHATGEILLIQDSDLEYDPRDYPRLLEPLLEGKADVVYGSRFLGGPHRVLFFWHFVGNKFLTLVSNLVNNLNLTDMETGYKAFRKQVLSRFPLKANRFGFEPEFTAKTARHGCRIYEVPIAYHGRDYSEGKKVTWRDGVAALFEILRFRFFD